MAKSPDNVQTYVPTTPEAGKSTPKGTAPLDYSSESTSDAHDWAAINDWAEEVNYHVAKQQRRVEREIRKRNKPKEVEKKEARPEKVETAPSYTPSKIKGRSNKKTWR